MVLKYLTVNNELIPPLKMRNNFIYLGNSFSFDMNVDIQAGLVTDMNKYFDILN